MVRRKEAIALVIIPSRVREVYAIKFVAVATIFTVSAAVGKGYFTDERAGRIAAGVLCCYLTTHIRKAVYYAF